MVSASRRRLLLPTILAAVLAAEITGIAIARSAPLPVAPQPSVAGTASALVGGAALAAAVPATETRVDAERDAVATGLVRTSPSVANLRRPAPRLETPSRTSRTTTAPANPTSTRTVAATPSSTSFHGRNHVWIPSLGISRSVQSFPCTRSRPPDAGVYRWGCAGRNNVYLLSHAWSTFKPLHDAYVSGRLRKGMTVWYANGASRVHAYRVVWWRVVAPTTAASWAWASLSRPSMTLQTCVGARSQYRLMVRLIQVR